MRAKRQNITTTVKLLLNYRIVLICFANCITVWFIHHLLYCIVILGNTYDNHLQRLIILQNKAVKIVSGGQRKDHVTPFYCRSQILKPKDLYVYEEAKLMHKNSRKKLPNRFTSVTAERLALHSC